MAGNSTSLQRNLTVTVLTLNLPAGTYWVQGQTTVEMHKDAAITCRIRDTFSGASAVDGPRTLPSGQFIFPRQRLVSSHFVALPTARAVVYECYGGGFDSSPEGTPIGIALEGMLQALPVASFTSTGGP